MSSQELIQLGIIGEVLIRILGRLTAQKPEELMIWCAGRVYRWTIPDGRLELAVHPHQARLLVRLPSHNGPVGGITVPIGTREGRREDWANQIYPIGLLLRHAYDAAIREQPDQRYFGLVDRRS